jgi:hypothetical protein
LFWQSLGTEKNLFPHTHKSHPLFALGSTSAYPRHTFFSLLFPSNHPSLATTGFCPPCIQDTLFRGWSLGRCLRLSVDVRLRSGRRALQSCTGILPQAFAFRALSPVPLVPSLSQTCSAPRERERHCHTSDPSIPKSHSRIPCQIERVFTKFHPTKHSTLLHSRSPQRGVCCPLGFINRFHWPLVAQFKLNVIPVPPSGIGASRIPLVRGGCVGLSGHRLTSARHIKVSKPILLAYP